MVVTSYMLTYPVQWSPYGLDNRLSCGRKKYDMMSCTPSKSSPVKFGSIICCDITISIFLALIGLGYDA